MSPEEAQKLYTQRCIDYPCYFAQNVLKTNLWSKQKEILNAIRDHNRVVVASCHASGKSRVAAMASLWFYSAHENAQVITTAPTQRQVENVLWKEIRNLFNKATERLEGTLADKAPYLAAHERKNIQGFTAPPRDENKFQGFHEDNLLIIADEATGITREVFNGILGILSGDNNKLFMPANPVDETGFFGEAFKDPNYQKIQISAFDTPNFTAFDLKEADFASTLWKDKIDGRPLPFKYLINPSWVAEQYKYKGTPFWDSRVMGRFPDTVENALIPLSWIHRSFVDKVYLKPRAAKKTLAVDVARFGDDETVIYAKFDEQIKCVGRHNGLNTMDVASEVATTIDKYQVLHQNVVVDEVGIGSGVVDRLHQLKYFVKGFNGGGKSRESKFRNIRAEAYWTLRTALQEGSVKIESSSDLQAQLSATTWKLTPTGLIQMDSKDDIKKRIGRSPDDADALSMLFSSAKPFNLTYQTVDATGIGRR